MGISWDKEKKGLAVKFRAESPPSKIKKWKIKIRINNNDNGK